MTRTMLIRHPGASTRICLTQPTICFCLVICLFVNSRAGAQAIDKRVLELEGRRIAVIEKIRPAVIAIFARGGQGGGSGVLISKDGYALTNFHVVQGCGPAMQCGLPDGILYDAVLVGLDKVGDVALIKLLPQKAGRPFPFAVMGDSDKLKAGDWSLALGNPFLLATDFTPTVTFGLISGVHRYQYPEGKGLLEYTDCIQVDTSINPGNSGGPLFNMDGELIGINGRISLEKRGRVNSGVGYAISINQIKNFMGHLRAGLDVDHATLGAFVENKVDESQNGMIVTKILEECDARRRGLDLQDELVSFAGRPISNRNQFQNVLGLLPKGWRVPLVFRRENAKHEILVRLMGVQRAEIDDGSPKPPEAPAPKIPKDSPAAKFVESKPGFANFYFNRLERDRVWKGFHNHGDFSKFTGPWTITAELETKQSNASARIVLSDGAKSDQSKKSLPTVRLTLGPVEFAIEPLKTGQDPAELRAPPQSGGLLMALYQYRRLLVHGGKGFEGRFSHGGNEPFYPMPLDRTVPKSFGDLRVDTEVLQTEHAATSSKWYFSPSDQTLLGGEITVVPNEDPCELYFSDYRTVEGGSLPYRIEIRFGDNRFGILHVQSYELAAK
jgi:serine protease Do